MTGITAYSAYVPRYRLARKVIAEAWGAPAAPGMKAVRAFDEDTITMGQAAACRCLPYCGAIGGLSFASTSAPFWQRSPASLMAAHCDLPASAATADFGGSTRCVAGALRAAFDAAAARGQSTLVVAAEAREGKPESTEEMLFGDAAAAVAVGGENVIAELIGSASHSDDFLDEWRRDFDPHVHSFASRFSTTRGCVANTANAARAALAQAGVAVDAVTRAVLPSPDGKSHRELAKALGIAADRVEDPRAGDIGVTGAAMPLLLLSHALDTAAPGDVILLAAYGEGADAFVFRVSDQILALPRPLLRAEPAMIEYPSYPLYIKLRDWLRSTAEAADVSNVLWEREESQNVRLRGTFCAACGNLQFPMTRVCVVCRSTGNLEERPMPRTGTVFTYTKDYLYEAPVQPTVMAVVELDGGGKFLCQMTDCVGEVEIGMRVELVLRRMREGPAMHHYYWKCRAI